MANQNQGLLQKLNALDFYQETGPKSLGREWVQQVFLPALNQDTLPINDLLNTVCQHIAIQLANATDRLKPTTMLITGGGAFNNFLDRLHPVAKQAHHHNPRSAVG